MSKPKIPRNTAELIAAVRGYPAPPPSSALPIEVSGCHDCPHHDEYGDPWMCDSAERQIHRSKYFDGGPPRWCPLRKQDHLVTLRVK